MSKVLVVNDSKFESLVLKDILFGLGHDVKISNEKDCISHVASYQPQIVIANLTMDGITGDVLLEMIKSKHPEIQCILSSCSNIRLEDYRDRKVDGVFRTPTEPAKLKQVLTEAQNICTVETGKKDTGVSEPKAVNEEKEIEKLFTDDRPDQDLQNRRYAFCPFCGNRLPSSSTSFVFCPMCGGKL